MCNYTNLKPSLQSSNLTTSVQYGSSAIVALQWSVPSVSNTSCLCSYFALYNMTTQFAETNCSRSYQNTGVDVYQRNIPFSGGLYYLRVGRKNSCYFFNFDNFLTQKDDSTELVSDATMLICVEEYPQNITFLSPQVLHFVDVRFVNYSEFAIRFTSSFFKLGIKFWCCMLSNARFL